MVLSHSLENKIVSSEPLSIDFPVNEKSPNVKVDDSENVIDPKLNLLSCKECEFQSHSQEGMNEHEIGHKQYPCTICEYRSASCDEIL